MSRTPPGSPVEEKLGERSGSAPPSIPGLDRSRTGMLNSGAGSNWSATLRDKSRQPSPVAASVGLALDLGGADEQERQYRTAEWTRQEQPPVIRSPSEFAGQFPSVDDLERTDFATATTWTGRHEVPFPSVPSSRPGGPPLPPPPKPFDPEFTATEHSRLSGPRSPTNRPDAQPSRPLPQQPPPPLPPTAPKQFTLPFTNEILPVDLYSYLEMALGDDGRGPRVLMLDVRTREEFDAGRVLGEVVCLEPIIIREGLVLT